MEELKEVNLEELEENYGSELRNRIDFDINHSKENEQDWKLEIIDETKNFIMIGFVTRSYTQVYEVSKKRKVIDDKYLIGSMECKKILDLMNSLKA